MIETESQHACVYDRRKGKKENLCVAKVKTTEMKNYLLKAEIKSCKK